MKSLYLVISIDTECDKDKNWLIPKPVSTRNVLEDLPQVLHPVFVRQGFQPTYLLSPELIRDEECRRALTSLKGRYELGTHLHAEFIEPDAIAEPPGTFVFQGDLPKEIERSKIENLTQLFRSAFGYRPTSFRAGRFGMGPHTLEILSDLGYLVDSSVFPLRITKTASRELNFYDRTSRPYFTGSHTNDLLELPLTVTSDLFLALPGGMRRWLGPSTLLNTVASVFMGRSRVKTLTLRPSTHSVPTMKKVVDRWLEYCKRDEIVFLNMMFHSNELRPGASPTCQTPGEVQEFIGRLESTLEFVLSLGAGAATMSDAWFLLKKRPVPASPAMAYEEARGEKAAS